MNESGSRGERMAALFLLGLAAFTPPLLDVFDAGADVTVLGIPLLYLYLFAAWAALIVLMAMAAERRAREDSEEPPTDESGTPNYSI